MKTANGALFSQSKEHKEVSDQLEFGQTRAKLAN